MKEEQDYLRDITEIRTMMERSSKFMSLSGWAGIMAGVYALAGAWIAYKVIQFNPVEIVGDSGVLPGSVSRVILLALSVLVLALSTAIYFSRRKASQREEKAWNATTKRLLMNMAVPLVAGGLLILVLISKGLIGLMVPSSLIFYGLALYNAGRYTYEEVSMLGIIQIGLGLLCSYFMEYGLLFWSLGFGVVHIVYGIYMHYKYER